MRARRSLRLPSPLAFAVSVVRAFIGNGGLMLAAAVAHHMLLSAIPLLMVTLSLFSRFVDRAQLATVLTAELSQILPRDRASWVVDSALAFTEAPEVSGVFGLGSLLVFSTLAFRTLQRAIDVIFARHSARRTRSLVSTAAVSVAYVLAIGAASALQTVALIGLDRLSTGMGPLLPGAALWLSFGGLLVLLSSIYVVMPLGEVRLGIAVRAGTWAALSWMLVQRLLIYYFETFSPVDWIFGSMAAVIAVLISFEVLAAIVLLGAQAVAEAHRR